MISAQAQRGQLRSEIVRALKAYNIKASFREKLRENNQNVSGFLQRSITSTKYLKSVSVSSKIDSTTGIITDVVVSVQIPWGSYVIELDEKGGANNSSTADAEFIKQWIRKKGISTSLTVSSKLKSGNTVSYTYNNTDSSRSAMAYWVAKNINSEGEVRTRYNYSEEIEFELNDVFSIAVSNWFGNIGLELLGDVEVEISNLI